MTTTSNVVLCVAAACSVGMLLYAYMTTGNPAAAALLLAANMGITVWLVKLLRGKT